MTMENRLYSTCTYTNKVLFYLSLLNNHSMYYTLVVKTRYI